MIPRELKLSKQRDQLLVTWEDGSVSQLPSPFLRAASRSASSVAAGLRGEVIADPNVTLTDVEPIGNYAVRLTFSDGHDRGIFPFAYLLELAQSQAPQQAGCCHG